MSGEEPQLRFAGESHLEKPEEADLDGYSNYPPPSSELLGPYI